MADIRSTPVANRPAYYLAGLLDAANEAVSKPFGYENDPVRAITNLLGIPAVVKTLENTAYGMPNTTGSGMARQLRPEAKEALGVLAPMGPGAAKAAVKGAVAAGKYAAPKVGQMAEQYAVKTGLIDPMIAWHGSPYAFDKFDLAHVGKGEGAQAYGHGMYFAESPKVAGEYRTRLSPDVTVASKGVDSAYKFAAESFKESGAGFEEALKGLSQAYKNAKPADLEAAARSVFDMPYGTLYKVDIPDNAAGTFLDWDKPLSQQAKVVQDAINKSEYGIEDMAYTLSGKTDPKGNALYEVLRQVNKTPDAASAWLRENGVQGIRYLDGGSRGAGAGTSNFVVFDPSIVKILERNGQPMGLLEGAQKTPYELAHEVAQKNAVEMLGLPPNNTAMDRARVLGFDGDLYHGTTNDFPAFQVSDRSNVYATDTPSIADIYANATGRHKALREVNADPNVIPLKYRGKLMEVSDQGPTGGGYYSDNLAAALGTDRHRGLIKEVPNHGYSGVKITNIDDLGGRQTQYVFPDPAVLRSRFAAFDPARINEPDLLAAGVPLGLLAGTQVDIPKPKKASKK